MYTEGLAVYVYLWELFNSMTSAFMAPKHELYSNSNQACAGLKN